MDLKSIIEALLFVSGRPLGTSEMMEILASDTSALSPTRETLETVLGDLQAEWEGRGGGIRLQRVAEGYEFRSLAEYAHWIRLLNRPKAQRLTLPAVETLAMIAYRQPVTRTEIEAIRGVDTAAVLKTLLERRLVRVIGRKEEPGRPLLYATSKEFLEFFGLNELSDLPPLKELEEMIRSQAEEIRPEEADLSVSDLISTPEELSTLEEEDRAALEELDQKMKHLKEIEKTVQEPEPMVDETTQKN